MSPALPRASLFTPAPLLDPAILAAARCGARVLARAGGRLLGGAVAAAVVWVMLAGPGFVSDRSGTAGLRHAARVASR